MRLPEVNSGEQANSTARRRDIQSFENEQLAEERIERQGQGDEIERRIEEAEEELTREEFEEGIEALNDTVQSFHENLEFELHETTEQMMARLVDLRDNEVIKELPPEEVLDMLGKIREMVGLIVDERI
ncbi:flagellar protein FlaG [Fuchsiella alkaliacetigena]|uniref:flagellar protein FlaG n=1 Tax=Fuchsiella alkaliacetigena TaxID=957042 RepID=UPI00200B4CE1|nr:flagellar protein FlaG [Fuchsiella alkaliacetigena]MCK8824187.1 flagellar protein FlaG [Fuchsiella alkaliacetigena]